MPISSDPVAIPPKLLARLEKEQFRAELHARVERDFRYHPPHGDQPVRYSRITEACRDLAFLIVDLTPSSREQSLALTAIQEARMWANASIAINEAQGGEEA